MTISAKSLITQMLLVRNLCSVHYLADIFLNFRDNRLSFSKKLTYISDNRVNGKYIRCLNRLRNGNLYQFCANAYISQILNIYTFDWSIKICCTLWNLQIRSHLSCLKTIHVIKIFFYIDAFISERIFFFNSYTDAYRHVILSTHRHWKMWQNTSKISFYNVIANIIIN